MPETNSIENKPSSGHPGACPFLPFPPTLMSYRDLQKTVGDSAKGSTDLHWAASAYANYLWIRRQPARSILALCRAIYLNPADLNPATRQPYDALVWMLREYTGEGFLGNPRISFSRQATRIDPARPLKRRRAWALWYLTVTAMPWLAPDPKVSENAPPQADLAAALNAYGLAREGTRFQEAMKTASTRASQDSPEPEGGSACPSSGLSPA